MPAPAGVEIAGLATQSGNVVDGYRAVGPMLRSLPRAEVLVIAATPGSLALYATAFPLALGSSVRYIDRDPARVALATARGASAIQHAGPWPRCFEPAPVTVDVTGDEGGLACVLRSTERYRYCSSLAIHFGPEPTLPMLERYTRGITFHTSRADARRYLPAVIELINTGVFDPAIIPSVARACDKAGSRSLSLPGLGATDVFPCGPVTNTACVKISPDHGARRASARSTPARGE